jgi:hypothetical protein
VLEDRSLDRDRAERGSFDAWLHHIPRPLGRSLSWTIAQPTRWCSRFLRGVVLLEPLREDY